MGRSHSVPWRASEERVLLAVRLTPKASRDQVAGTGEGPDGPHVIAKVRALPDKGEANAALERLIARWLDVPQRDVALAAGARSRLKSVAIAGEPDRIVALLAAALSALK